VTSVVQEQDTIVALATAIGRGAIALVRLSGPEAFAIVASEAQSAERERLWAAVKKFNPFYAQYEKITDRQIPVVVLRRAS